MMYIKLDYDLGEVRVAVDPTEAVAAALAAMHAAALAAMHADARGHPRPVEEYVFEYVDETGERRVLGAEGGTLGDAGIDGCNEKVEMRLQRKYAARAQLAACGEAVYGWVEAEGDDSRDTFDGLFRERAVRSAVLKALEEGRSGRNRLQLLAAAEVPRPGFVAGVAGRAFAEQLARLGLGGGTAELLECCKEMGGENGAMGAALQHAAGTLPGNEITAMSRAELVGALVSEGAPLDVQDGQYNATALIRACANGRAEVAKLLIDKGAALDMQDQYNRTALMLACLKGHAEVAKLLIDKGAALDMQNQDNKTALSGALEQGLYDIAEMMMRRGAALEEGSIRELTGEQKAKYWELCRALSASSMLAVTGPAAAPATWEAFGGTWSYVDYRRLSCPCLPCRGAAGSWEGGCEFGMTRRGEGGEDAPCTSDVTPSRKRGRHSQC